MATFNIFKGIYAKNCYLQLRLSVVIVLSVKVETMRRRKIHKKEYVEKLEQKLENGFDCRLARISVGT